MNHTFDFMLGRRQALALGTSAFAAACLAACGNNAQTSDTDAQSDTATTTATSGQAAQLTVTPGKLTVATGNPAYEPWVINDDPASGEGFEAAVIYALADELGFAKDDVVWVRTSFDEAFAPGEHDWDLNIQQVSISEDRQKAVDFSPAYYRPAQSIVVKKDGKYATATTCADFADAIIGVQVGSTAYDYVQTILKNGDTTGIEVYDDNAAAAAAVNSGQADAVVTDTPTAVYMAGAFAEDEQIKDAIVVGQIPDTEDEHGLGITLAKGSALTPLVEKAMNTILDNRTVDGLILQWLAEYTTNIPTLKQ